MSESNRTTGVRWLPVRGMLPPASAPCSARSGSCTPAVSADAASVEAAASAPGTTLVVTTPAASSDAAMSSFRLSADLLARAASLRSPSSATMASTACEFKLSELRMSRRRKRANILVPARLLGIVPGDPRNNAAALLPPLGGSAAPEDSLRSRSSTFVPFGVVAAAAAAAVVVVVAVVAVCLFASSLPELPRAGDMNPRMNPMRRAPRPSALLVRDRPRSSDRDRCSIDAEWSSKFGVGVRVPLAQIRASPTPPMPPALPPLLLFPPAYRASTRPWDLLSAASPPESTCDSTSCSLGRHPGDRCGSEAPVCGSSSLD
mmetsp:Transcript_10408/g.27697  ORF Transcript_10408/g.27697 Transcript_10408/m.27697 type:complete len:318 (-) Transcript_10408:100-1053(-)